MLTIVKVDIEEANSVFELFAPIPVLVVNGRMTTKVFQRLTFTR